MSTLFFFGAGSSYGSLDCTPYCPPLGYQLFDKLKNAGGIAKTISGEFADRFRKDFEEGMDAFFDEHSEDVPEFQRQIAKYFAQFKPGHNNLYRKLISILQQSSNEYIFSTTNYDLLIDIAINQAGFLISYSGLPVKKENIPLIKMHGSCSFLPVVALDQIVDVKFKVPRTGCCLEAPVKAAAPEEIFKFCESHDSIAPVMAMYAGSKWTPFCRRFIQSQQEYWQNEVYQANCIFIIGAGFHEQDIHIWEPLAKSTAWLGYVGPKSDDLFRWANRSNRKQVDIVAKTFEDAIPLIAQHMNRS